jgi:hypothetical protein
VSLPVRWLGLVLWSAYRKVVVGIQRWRRAIDFLRCRLNRIRSFKLSPGWPRGGLET